MKKLFFLAISLLVLSVSFSAVAEMPGIDGSNAYDIILSLEKTGIPKPKTKTIDDGFQWSSDPVTIGKTTMMYDIKANDKHEVCSATFTMTGKNNGFLWFASTLPYDSSDKDKSSSFVDSHLTGSASSITVGDAIFEVMPQKNGAVLKISDVDAAAYYDELLSAKLGLK